MDKKNKRDDLIKRLTQQGIFGKEASKGSYEYDRIEGNSSEVFLKNINDFYSKEIHSIFRPYPIALIKIILSLFFKNNKEHTEIADYFTLIFQRDIDGFKNSCIKNKYLNSLEAGHAFKQSINSKNPLIIWELAKNSFLANNEFYNILIGVILINYRASIEKPYKLNTLTMKYGNKVNQLKELNPSDENYNLFFELMRPEIRNAIGHQTIWYNKETEIVTYLNDKTEKNETISIQDFILLNSKASYLAEAYLVAMSTIGIFISGSVQDKTRLPKKLFLYLMDIIPPK
ncbi:MAG: hypothetical protein IMY72_10570 [Bacteroidetes bacterium]|nr:hypothetical protein [Bacteroidota bacterium]